MLKTDVFRFVIIYGVFLAAFTSAFFVIYDHSGVDDFIAILKKVVEAEFDSTELMGGNHPIVAVILLIAYVVTVTVLLINLLIAMMGDTFGQTKDVADKVWHMSYADIIVSLESEMTRKEWEDPKKRYWMDIEGRRWLQIEEVNDTQYLKKDKGRKDVQEMMSEYDVNKDGVVTFEELQAALKKQDEKQAERDYEHNVLSKPVEIDALGTGGKRSSAIYGRAQQQGGDSSVDADEIAKIVTQEF